MWLESVEFAVTHYPSLTIPDESVTIRGGDSLTAGFSHLGETMMKGKPLFPALYAATLFTRDRKRRVVVR